MFFFEWNEYLYWYFNVIIFIVWYLKKVKWHWWNQIYPNVPKAYSAWNCFLLNLSKKVKCNLFCLNLDTGYLLYVIVWIPKAFSLPSHHSRVVFTISNGFSLGRGKNVPFFAMFHLNLLWLRKIYIDSDTSTSNSQM